MPATSAAIIEHPARARQSVLSVRDLKTSFLTKRGWTPT